MGACLVALEAAGLGCCSGSFRLESDLDELEIVLVSGSCEGFMDLSESSSGHEGVFLSFESSLTRLRDQEIWESSEA